MKIPFSIELRPQIESGEYKVVTRDDRPARIICWDRFATKRSDNCNIVALVTGTTYESTYYYYQDGHLWNKANGEGDSPLDLFIVIPEPELRESEDERIRKIIIKHFEEIANKNEQSWINLDIPYILAYLEKQKENPKSADSIPSDCVSDAKCEDKSPKHSDSYGTDIRDTPAYWKGWDDAMKQKEQKPAEPSDKELERHQKELYDFKVFAAKQAREHHISFVHDFEWNNFCAELLSYFNEKQEWSDEDEEKLKAICTYLRDYSRLAKLGDKLRFNEYCDFLESLRPQKLDASKLENFDPVDVLNRIKTEWPMAWEKVVGKQEWGEEHLRDTTMMDKSLEEAAYKYSFDSRPSIYGQVDVIDAFKAGAEWQASQMPMPEDTVLFNKGVEEGRRLEREDMLKAAEECELSWAGTFLAIDLNMVALGYSEKDKVKVIVLKAEEE